MSECELGQKSDHPNQPDQTRNQPVQNAPLVTTGTEFTIFTLARSVAELPVGDSCSQKERGAQSQKA